MFDYLKFKASAYKHKYETAIEYKKHRVLYGELYEKVNAVYNSVCQMSLQDTIVLLSRDVEQTICLSLAASRAGLRCVHADPMMSFDDAVAIGNTYNPDVVVLPSSELIRIGEAFVKTGCKRAVITGIPTKETVFSSEFYYNDFLEMNNYRVSTTDDNNVADHVFADALPETIPDISTISIDDGICLDLPAFSSVAAAWLSEILETGHKCVIAEKYAPNIFKKQKIKTVVTSRPETFDGFSCDTLKVTLPDGIFFVGDGIFDSTSLSMKMTQKCKRQITCEYVDGKIRSIVYLTPDEDVSSVTGTSFALSLKTAATEVFYPFAADKTFIFRQKTN